MKKSVLFLLVSIGISQFFFANSLTAKLSIKSTFEYSFNLKIGSNYPDYQQTQKIGFGKETTGGQGGDTLRVSNFSELQKALQFTDKKRIVILQNDINLYAKDVDVKFPNISIIGNAHKIHGGMISVEVNNVYVYNTIFDNENTRGDAFQVTSWYGKTVENIYLKNCEFLNGADESLDFRVAHNTGTVKNITVENCRILNENGYGVLAGDKTENITFYKNEMNSYERNIRAGSTVGFAFEMINNYVHNWRNSATQTSWGVKFSVVNNYYTTKRAKANPDFIVKDANNSTGDITKTHAYIKGNYSKQGWGVRPQLEPYLKDTPFADSGVLQLALPVEQVKDLHFGVIKE